MQQAEIEIFTIEAAKALRDIPLLQHFAAPNSPSDVAKAANMPANLVHHHAKRALESGILFEAKRENGKVFYQLAARVFKHARHLLDEEDTKREDLQTLEQAFVRAYVQSDHLASRENPEYAFYSFSTKHRTPDSLTDVNNDTPNFCPAHFQTKTVQLTQATYIKLAQQLATLLSEIGAESDSSASSETRPCTFAVLAFEGVLRPGNDNSETISTFLPMNKTPKL